MGRITGLTESKSKSAYDVLYTHYLDYFKSLEKDLKRNKKIDKTQFKSKPNRIEMAVTGYNRSDFEISVVIFFKIFSKGKMGDAIQYDVVVSRPDADDLIETIEVGFDKELDLKSFILQQFS